MSASLVGSEMCIRDRATAGLCDEAFVTLWPSRKRKRSESRMRQPACSTCLLYTSDAADDM
eukprot:4332598-Alexandrium_andersonii.AAC.1